MFFYHIPHAISILFRNFVAETATTKAVHLTMITTLGLVENSYAYDVQSVVTMDDLFG